MHRFVSWLRNHGRVSATLAFGVLAVGLGAAGLRVDPGFETVRAEVGAWVAWTGLAFDAAGLLTLSQPEAPPTNGLFVAARVLALLFALTAVVTVAAEVSDPFRQWLRRRRIGVASWWAGRREKGSDCGHTVVVGLGELGRRVVADLRAAGRDVVVVEADPQVTGGPAGAEAHRLGALVVTADARDAEAHRLADLRHARAVVIATGDEAYNLSVASALAAAPPAQVPGFTAPLSVRVHLGDPAFAEAFGHHALFEGREAPEGERPVQVQTFNLQERLARDLLLGADYSRARAETSPALCRLPYAPTAGEVAHWAIVGFGPMGQTVALQAARLAHFDGERRLRLSIIDDFDHDPGARLSRDRFLDRHPGFGPRPFFGADDDESNPEAFSIARHEARSDPDRDGWAYGHWRPAEPDWRTRGDGAGRHPRAVEYAVNAEYLDLPTEPDAPALVERLVVRFGTGSPPVRPVVVVCFEDEPRTFRTALALQRAFAEATAQGRVPCPFPVFAYLPSENGLSGLIEGCEALHGGPECAVPVHPFGALDPGELLRWIERPALSRMAQAVHEAYRAAEAKKARSVPAFDALALAERRSNEDAAAHLDVKLDAVGFRRHPLRNGKAPTLPVTDEQRTRLARIEHNRYLGERLSSGWRYGEKASGPQRRPSFLPWPALPPAEQAKDVQQVAALTTLLGGVDQTTAPAESPTPPGGQPSPKRPAPPEPDGPRNA